jgi:FkbM family methyltransferase
MASDKDSARLLREKWEKETIRAYFEHRRDGSVIEVGANDPLRHTSQSLHLEQELGWKSILVEPNPDLAEQARQSRKDAQVFEFACVSRDDLGEISFYIPVNGESVEIHSHAAIAKNIDDHDYDTHRELRVRSRTLNSIIDACALPSIDLLSIDVEGAEMEVLKGLDLQKHRPKLILLEDKHVFLDKHRHLKRNGYRLVKRTCQNSWYVPTDATLPARSLHERWSLWRRLYLSIWIKKTKLATQKRSLSPFCSL